MANFDDLKILQTEKVPVEVLLRGPDQLELLTGEIGMNNPIFSKHLYRPQLALTGNFSLFNHKAIQLFGNTEMLYLKSLDPAIRYETFRKITEHPIPCILVTNNHNIEPDFIKIAKDNNVPVLLTKSDTTKASILISEYLDDQFAPQAVVHGSFVDVFGVGVLFTGRSGIGKSEIALDLVERGHRLVADDIVMLTKKRDTIIMGTGTSMVQHFMEIRGLGIIDVRQMFGIRSIRFQKRLEIIVELLEWNKQEEYTRIGLDEQTSKVMDVDISTIKLPIFPGKNITVISEVIAINYLLRMYGYNAAKVFSDKLQDEIQNKQKLKTGFSNQRNVSWFQFDSE